MILVELNGGIGNQMFQYAAAKSLALHHRTTLKLDISPGTDKSMPQELKPRQFDLHYFNLPDKVADTTNIDSFISRSALEKIKEKTKPNHKRKIYREPFFHFDSNFFDTETDVYLKGLWQSEKYFTSYKKEIKNIFQFTSETIKAFQEVSFRLKQQNSVSIHIRRGDYLAKVSLEVLGLIPLEHYQNAIELINSKIPGSSFYFFSDDIQWVKENFQIPNATFVSGDISKDHVEDLYLMSQCRHNIIANSSFSWWSAWLNDNPEKIVIAPKKWFNKGPKDTQDLLPEKWIKI
jgi:hypothetical protein